MNCLRFKVFSLLLGLVLLTGCTMKNDGGLVPRPAPPVPFQMLDGNYEVLRDHKGKTVVVLFWETTCRFSRSTIRELNELADKYKNNTVFYAVSIDKPEKLQDLKERIKADELTNLRHSFSGNEGYDEAYMYLQASWIPHLFVIDPSGTIVYAGRDIEDMEQFLPGYKEE